MARINNKVELLRALEGTEKQFDALLERNCKGELQDPVIVVTPKTGGPGGGGGGGVNKSVEPTVQGQTFSKEDKEVSQAFKQINQLGLKDGLEEFIKKLLAASLMLDQFSIQYYIQQLYNGPYAKFAKKLAKFQGIFQAIPDVLGIISAANRSNSSTPVFSGVAAAVSVGVLDKSPSFIQRELNNIVQTTSEVFNYNFKSSILDDNTLPYIDKRPIQREAAELIDGFTSDVRAVGNYMLKDVKAFNIIAHPILGIAQRLLDIIKAFLGKDAFRLLEFKKNINYFNAQQNVSSTSNNSIPRLLVFMDKVISETGDDELKERCIELRTGLTGNVVINPVQVNDNPLSSTLTLGNSLDGSNLYTVEGRLGSRRSDPDFIPPPPLSGCPPGQELYNGECIDECPTGYVRNEETGLCEEDLCPDECDDTGLKY